MKYTNRQSDVMRDILKGGYDEILLDGGARSGKTYLIIMMLLFLAAAYPIRILAARLRFNHAKNSLWSQTLIPILEQHFKGHYEINRSDYIIKLYGKSEIWLGGLDDKDRTDKILGQEYSIIYLNEATDISSTTIEKVKTRLAQNIRGFKNFLIMDCNPRSPQHYLYKRFILHENIGSAKLYRARFLPEDNVDNLPSGYIESYLDNLTGTSKDRFRYGKWTNIEGAIYRNLKEENIIYLDRDLLHYQDVTIGIDFGYNSAITIWGIKDNKGYCIYDKTIINGITKDIIDYLKSIPFTNKYVIYADHELDRIQEIAAAGFIIKKAYKEVAAGDSTINGMELYFDVNCKDTFDCLQNMLLLQDDNGNFIEGKHVKENDHLGDGSRYALHGWKMDNIGGSTGAFSIIGNVIRG